MWQFSAPPRFISTRPGRDRMQTKPIHRIKNALPVTILLLFASLISQCRSVGKPTSRSMSHLGAGFRWSVYGPKFDPGAQYWARVGKEMAARFPGAHPEAIWIVSRIKGQGTILNFPSPALDPLIATSEEDGNEASLSLFDHLGFRVWLQVEPGNAPVDKLIHLMLSRYSAHPCVIGVGVDVEWYHSTDKPEGQRVSDADAIAWLAAARSHGDKYRLFLKHWEIGKMPPTVREGILFVDDSQIFPSLNAMVTEFIQWGKAFSPAPVAFQYGYPSDEPWWGGLSDPPKAIGKKILAVVPNTEGLFWVDFTVLDVFPPNASESPAVPASMQPPGR